MQPTHACNFLLRFDAWPPEYDAIQWAPEYFDKVAELARQRNAEGIAFMGRLINSLLYTNVVTRHDENKNFKVQQITIELTQGWSAGGELADSFMQAVAESGDGIRSGAYPFTCKAANGSNQSLSNL